jgi:hypothetical protein
MGLTTTSTVPPGRDPLCIGTQALRAWLRSACPSGTKPFSHRKAIHYLGVYGVATPGYAPGSSGRRAGVNTCETQWVNLWSAKAIKHPKQPLISRHSTPGKAFLPLRGGPVGPLGFIPKAPDTATVLSGVSSDLSKMLSEGSSAHPQHHATV